jgi:glycosyltransferase involved in cell wall biosynthesis
MRIVLVTHFYPAHGGGVENVAAQLATRMAADGAEIVWCASDTDAPPVFPGVRCEPMTTWNAIERISGFPYPLWGPRSLRRLARCIRSADAVHVHDCIYSGSLAAGWLARRYGKRLVVTQHIGTLPLPLPLRPLLAAANRIGAGCILQAADGVAFISPAVLQYFETLCGPSSRFHYVPNGVDAETFHSEEGEPRQRRGAMGFDPDRPLLLFVGRFVSKKRLPIIRAMAALCPDWQWCVIGHGPERPDTWGLDNVRVMPPMGQRELAAYYRAADLLVLPSAGEGFPLVVQEAMACGLPACITSEVAAGARMPANVWLELPEAAFETASRGAAVIAEWLASSAAFRITQRVLCAHYAAQTWRWDAAAQSHLQWMR